MFIILKLTHSLNVYAILTALKDTVWTPHAELPGRTWKAHTFPFVPLGTEKKPEREYSWKFSDVLP